ncbi:MAG: peptidase S41 [Rhodospirillaceae bacterium]|nr:peptidase S41 [Rhodospirillaceae bacterium]
MNGLNISTARFSHAAAVSAFLLLAACMQIGPAAETEYSNEYSRAMFDTGYQFINERYIVPVSLRTLSFSGLASLHQIDSKLDIRPKGRDIEVRYQKRTVGQFTAPRDEDPMAWSQATVDAIAIARDASPVLADTRAEAVFKAVFDGALSPLDKFSRYDDAETAAEKRAYRDGFGGIGVTITKEDHDALILSVTEGGPAANGGVQAEDRITHIEGEYIGRWTQRQLIEALRGPINSAVNFTVSRGQSPAPISITLRRQHVVPETVEVRRKADIAIIRLAGFNVDSAKDLRRAVKRQMQSVEGPPAGFVLDLRSNPGGRLDISIDVADLFLDSGEIIVTHGRHPSSRQAYAASRGDETGQRPIVTLINGNSASAAEIVTAALQDHGRAVVIGTNSFGKGSVQSVLRLPNNGEITLTWSRFLTPSGYRLHELGVLPTVCTHGGGDLQTPDALAPAVRGGEYVIAGELGNWRATGNKDSASRASLRTICPSDGGLPDIDIALATEIIGDRALYSSLLKQADTAVAHR